MENCSDNKTLGVLNETKLYNINITFYELVSPTYNLSTSNTIISSFLTYCYI